MNIVKQFYLLISLFELKDKLIDLALESEKRVDIFLNTGRGNPN